MKTITLGIILLLSSFLLGCNQSEKPEDKQTVATRHTDEAEPIAISGQIFVVTKGRENITLGDESIALVDEKDLKQYYDSMAPQWESNLLVLQSNITQELSDYKSLNKIDLNKLLDAKTYWKSQERLYPVGSDDYETVMQWETKIDGAVFRMVAAAPVGIPLFVTPRPLSLRRQRDGQRWFGEPFPLESSTLAY